MRTIQPCYVKLTNGHIRSTNDIIGFGDLIVLLLSDLSWTTSTLYIMPPFVPNQYMLDKHDDKGQFDWEIYAWCLRDAIAKTGGFNTCDQQIREKLAYEHFMLGETDSVTYQGKTYYAENIKFSAVDEK